MSEYVECSCGIIKKGTVVSILKDRLDCNRLRVHMSKLKIMFSDGRSVVYDYDTDFQRDEVYNELVGKLGLKGESV